MKLKGGFDGLQKAFHAQEMATVKDAAGNARYHMDENMRPTGQSVQSPAQKMAVKKAAAASVKNRRIRAGMPPISVK